MLRPGVMLVGRYEIIEQIGSGGMADVYNAMDRSLNRHVAIKVLKREYSTDATFVKKFRVEAQSAGGLSHPNIVNVYDVGEEDGVHFIVMELVQGITLKNYIEMKGKLEIREALNISVQIASGLSAAHANRIIHRDIKPQNIIMSRDGKVKVTDFGIAKMADSKTVTTTAAGTVHYISPEQARGGYSDEKSDIYSLGITMYEMLTGRVPFEGETNVAVALSHIQDEMVPPTAYEPSIPKSFEKIILKCTQKKPENRYGTARALIADLRRVLTNPGGEYVVIPGISKGQTIVIPDDEVASLKKASLEQSRSRKVDPEPADGARKNQPPAKTGQKKYPSDYEDDDEEEDDSKIGKVMMGLGIVGFIILLMIILYFVASAAGLIGGKHDKKQDTTESAITTESETGLVKVPELLGKTEEEAKKILKEMGLGIKVKKGNSDDYDEDEIYDQDPKADEEVEIHTQVTVYISEGPAAVEFVLPDVENEEVYAARSILENKKLNIEVEREYSDTVDRDYVIRTSPEPGSRVKEGDTITLYVSDGPETTMVSVPDLHNKTLNEAIDAIVKAGLEYDGYNEDYSDEYPEGTVMLQSVSAGAQVEEGTGISVTLSLGPKPEETYTAYVYPDGPLGVDFTDANGEVQVFGEGNVTIMVEQGGVYNTLFDAFCHSNDEVPKELTCQSTSNADGKAYVYVEGNLFASWTVTFD